MKKRNVVFIHLLFWVTIVIIPFYMLNIRENHISPEDAYFIVQHIFNVIVFYLEYLILIPFIIKKKNLNKAIYYGAAFFILLAAARFLVNPSIREILGAFHMAPSIGRQIFFAFNWTLLFSFYSVIIYLSIEWFKERQIRFELIRQKQQSEIDLLKSQVNPHFLMNTLNNLYSLVYQGSKNAEDAILKLSDLMRYMLYDTKAEYVSLEKEIKYLHSFIELQLLRFTHKDFIEFEIKGDPSGKLIAPMLLVPFVENAFKHGNKNLQGLGIKINMIIEENRLAFNVTNMKASKSADKINESGIGLSNIKKRLEFQYAGKHELKINDGPELFEARLTIDL